MVRLLPLVVLAGLLLLFNACERHHVGELPEVQQEHLHPLDAHAGEEKAVEHAAPVPTSPTPANFFPNDKP